MVKFLATFRDAVSVSGKQSILLATEMKKTFKKNLMTKNIFMGLVSVQRASMPHCFKSFDSSPEALKLRLQRNNGIHERNNPVTIPVHFMLTPQPSHSVAPCLVKHR